LVSEKKEKLNKVIVDTVDEELKKSLAKQQPS